eukprot:12730712-Heterocapsa_arctica.AAC.1
MDIFPNRRELMGSWRFPTGLIRSRRNQRCPPWPPAVVPRGPTLSPVRFLSYLQPVHRIPCVTYNACGLSTQFGSLCW